MSVFSHISCHSAPYVAFFMRKEQSVVLGFLALEDGTDRLSRNVGKQLSLLAA
jgi:hypothetical protein